MAESSSGNLRVFSDQTVYMGFALLTFAGEARVVSGAGLDPAPSETVVRSLLTAFETLDFDAEKERYGTNVPGFFLRDYVKDWEALQVKSGFNGDPSDNDMSIDQVVSLMMGLWAASRWSTDSGNRNLASLDAHGGETG
jgi:hypothetical protein